MGAHLQQLLQYRFEYSSCLLEHLIIPESNDTKSLHNDVRIAASIERGLLLMLAAIELDYELCVDAGEIRYVGTNRNLAAKAKTAKLSLSQMLP